MKKILDFFKSNILVIKWTFWYFFVLWLILRFVFKFDMFSQYYWWKFFHATLHGFTGFVFGMLIYTAIPIYIATVITVYRKKELIITIPFLDKIFTFLTKFLPKKQEEKPVESVEEPQPEKTSEPEFPCDMPPELHIPYTRAKNHMSFMGSVSVYNKKIDTKPIEKEPTEESPIPIPTDFDISESLDEDNNDSIPTFKDISFDDEPEPEEKALENNTTKYFTSKNIEFETYKQFVATEKYVIYEHNDDDFWIMDDNTWFAAGKQIDSPTNDLIDLAKQNGLIPVIYLQSQNIMEIEDTINKFETAGIRVVKSLDELD